ncbi:DoxX family protein [Plastoroseomonas hellenica]|uniref:DoxX family protein n=1 Tax=Plastoroseomonas hellenica TaxID=2687306 RepID=UPI001BA7CDE5|nr:hypothetical protein [Plastoroseomonas hellenica]
MLFFGLVGGIAGLGALAHRLGAPGLATWRARLRLGLALGLLLFGADHLANPVRYLAMLPGTLPWPGAIVAGTGICEIAGAIGLLVPDLRRAAGIALGLYFICVFPANIHNALTGGAGISGLSAAPDWYFQLRLALQPLAVWAALWSAGVIGRPTHRRPQEA